MPSYTKTVALLLACVPLLTGVSGLRFSRNDSATDPYPQEEVVEMDASESDGLPTIGRYKDVWTKRYNLETHLKEPLPSSIQLVLGILTVAEKSAYRQVMRETWLRQKGVCYWSNSSRKRRCSVYAAFVIAKNSSKNISDEDMALAQSEEGMLVLDTVENMNRGKSFLWFATALKMFPWATHIGKIDMDTYPFIHKLMYRMNLNRPCKGQDSPYEFIGRPHTLHPGANFAVSCPASQCLTQFHGEQDTIPLGEGFHFIQGQFYIMSLPLVKAIAWKRAPGSEDQRMSAIVQHTARGQHFCVKIKRPDAWYHKNFHMSDAAYANDYYV